MHQTVETFRFRPEMLAPADRLPGVSAFMRIRNGADFMEATVRSHADFYDEIVAVYNQCTDATPEILSRLQAELGSKLKVFHYLPCVHPAGSKGHAQTPGEAPDSLVTYSNFALAQTRHQWAVKLDDDHLAIPAAVETIVGQIRSGTANDKLMHCFSGLNLMRMAEGAWRVPAAAPISGNGDIGYFRVTEGTHFVADPRFERFARGGVKRRFAGWFYWHLKYMKAGGGFANYELEANPGSRYARRLARLEASRLWDLEGVRSGLRPTLMDRLRALVDDKARLGVARDSSIAEAFPQTDLTAALDATAPGWRHLLERRA